MPYGEDITINVGDAVRIHPNYSGRKFHKLTHNTSYYVTEVEDDHVKCLIGVVSGNTIKVNMNKHYFEHACKEEKVERNYNLEIGDVVLITEGGWGFFPEDEDKYVEVVGFGEYLDGDPGVIVKPYNDTKLYTEAGADGTWMCGYESFGGKPMILLNTKEEFEAPEPTDELKELLGADTTNQSSALDKQVSGSHYKGCKIQPIEYIHANGLDYFQGNVVKYVTRHKDKNGKADIEKAIHYLELILELQYGN